MIIKKFKKFWYLYISVFLLFGNLIFRFIDQSALMTIFPLDYVNDISSNIAQLYFLDVCGYNNFCPYWYNGFITFKLSQPAWYFFAYPLYLLFGSALKATYISIVLLYLIGMILFLYFGKKHNFSKIKSLFFFSLFFGSAMAVGNFIRLGRPHELLAWVAFVAFAFVALKYKNKLLDKYSLWLIPLFSLIILSHQTVTILGGFLFLSLFLVQKNNIGRMKVILLAMVSLILTSFWLVPFIRDFLKTGSVDHILTITLFYFDKTHIGQTLATFVIPIGLMIIFWLYHRQNKNRNDVLFYLPILLLSLLLFFRLVYFIPILKFVYPDPYLHFFLFFLIYLFLNLNLKKLGIYSNIVKYGLVLVVIVSVLINLFITPFFIKYGEIENDTVELLSKIDGKFIVFSVSNIPVYSKAVYSYAPVKLNITTAQGWYPHVKEADYVHRLGKAYDSFLDEDCSATMTHLIYFNVTEVVSYNEGCDIFNKCGLNEKAKKGSVCLYNI